MASAAPAAPSAPAKKRVVAFSKLFSFATRTDLLLTFIGALAASASGCIFPLFTIIFSKLLNTFGGSNFQATVNEYALYFLIIAVAAAALGFIETALPMIAAENQMKQARSRYMRALLRQDAGWHDTNRTGEAASRLAEETVLWQAGIGEKLTGAIKFSVTFLAGLAVGFTKSWVLTLVIFATTPMLVFIIAFLRFATAGYEADASKAYARAGDACSEVFASVRTVAAFGGEEAEVKRYDSHLTVSEKAGQGKGVMFGLAVGGIFGTASTKRSPPARPPSHALTRRKPPALWATRSALHRCSPSTASRPTQA
jgi:ATP-binding cassette subfamily B (MDR/TAP) protein 1